MRWLCCSIIFCIGIVLVCCDEDDDRLSNAADVVTSLLNTTYIGHKGVPYLSTQSQYGVAMGIIGGLVKIWQNKQIMNKEMDSMNAKFDQLEADMEHEALQIIASNQWTAFQTDIIDPLNLMWGRMEAFMRGPSDKTYNDTLVYVCNGEQPWQVATKLDERMKGGDGNFLMTQTKAGNYHNDTFMTTKDIVMYRAFQTVMLQAFCTGLENGPNYNISGDFYYQKTLSIYKTVESTTVTNRISQETNYLNAVASWIIGKYVTSSNTNQFSNYAYSIYSELASNYQWDIFAVVVTKANCYGDGQQIGWYPGEGSSGYQPVSLYSKHASYADVHIIRSWKLDSHNSGYYSTFYNRLQDSHNHKGKAADWAYQLQGSPIDFVFMQTNWFCADATKVHGYGGNTMYLNIPYQNGYNGYGTGVSPNHQRPTTVQFDLGYYDRPINITLMPYDN